MESVSCECGKPGRWHGPTDGRREFMCVSCADDVIGSALFGAQNELSIHFHDCDYERHPEIERIQDLIRHAVNLMGGVDYLLSVERPSTASEAK